MSGGVFLKALTRFFFLLNFVYEQNLSKKTFFTKTPAKGKLGGFTLIELLVVVLIIGILAAIALPQYRIAVEKAKLTRAIPALDAFYTAQMEYYLANGSYTCDLDALSIKKPASGISMSCHNFGTWGFSQFGATHAFFEWNWYQGTLQRRCFASDEYKEQGTKVCRSFGSKPCGIGGDSRVCYLVGT